jgi:hypothetical protein
MARRILRKIRIAEISGCDRPANEHARAVIMKRAPEAHIGENYMSVDFGKLADVVLEGAAVALRKREPHLSHEQAFAKVYTSKEYRPAAEAERKAAAARLAGVPVARTAAHVLNSMDDNSINELTVQIKQAHPYLDDAGIVRLLIQRVEAADYRGDVAAARRAGDHAPGPYEDLTRRRGNDAAVGKALSDDDLLRLVDYERRLRPDLSDREIYSRVAGSSAVRRDRREFHAEMKAERRDETAVEVEDGAMDVLTAKAAELRREDPSLTPEMAFSKVFLDPANRSLAAAERAASRAALES